MQSVNPTRNLGRVCRGILAFCSPIFVLLLWSSVACAAGDVSASAMAGGIASAMSNQAQVATAGLLRAPVTDSSLIYLGQIFGSVEGVLGSTSGQLMGQIFRVFNWGMELAAVSFMSYSLLISLISSANEGAFMGERARGMLRSVRGAVGVGLLVPLPSGYCSVQVFILWICVQGVGLADHTWNAVVDYLANGGSFMSIGSAKSTEDATTAAATRIIGPADGSGLAMQVLVSEVCMGKLRQYVDPTQSGKIGRYVIKANAPAPNESKTVPNDRIFFGGEPGGSFWGACGSYTLQYQGQDAIYERAAFEMLSDSMEMAASLYISDGDNTNASPILRNVVTTTLAQSGMNYVNILHPALANQLSSAQKGYMHSLQASEQRGWLSAGSFYTTLTHLNRTYNDGQMKIAVSNAAFKENTNWSSHFEGLSHADQQAHLAALMLRPLQTYKCGAGNACAVCLESASDCHAMPTVAEQDLQSILNASAAMPNGQSTPGMRGRQLAAAGSEMMASSLVAAGPTGAAAMAVVLGVGMHLLSEWHDVLSNSTGAVTVAGNNDPIIQLHSLGDKMVNAGVGIWIGASAAIFIVGLATSVMGSETGLSSAIQVANETYSGIIVSVATALIVNGVMFSVYLPFVPLILYLFAGLGWMMTVVGAVTAGPLVALGITHPEGHDLLGKAEQALMLLLSVFLRPVCILIGFIAGTVLLRVAAHMMNFGFALLNFNQLLRDNIGFGFEGMSGFFIEYGVMLVYTLLIIRLVNFCYTLIHEVPERIMKWVGLSAYGAQYGSGAEQLQEIQSGISSGMETAVKSAVKAGSESFRAGTRLAKSAAQEAEAEVDQEAADYKEAHGVESPTVQSDSARRKAVAQKLISPFSRQSNMPTKLDQRPPAKENDDGPNIDDGLNIDDVTDDDSEA